MATQNPGVWGIDLGQCALKAIRLEQKDGNVVATAFEYIEQPKILSQPDADPDQLTREALEQFLSRNSIRGDSVIVSVPGQSGLARFVKLPPVQESKIADIVRFEAKQQIPFPLEEVVWDFQKLGSGVVTDGLALETEIGLFAMKRDMVNRALNQFKEVGIEVHGIQMAPLSLCNFVAYDLLGVGPDTPADADGPKPCVVALDIGTDNSNLVITNGKVIWQRPIPLGGNHFTRVLTKDLKLTFAKAEHLKRNAAKSPDLKKILGSLKSVLNDFVGEVQRSLGYFTNTHRDATIEYMVGLGNGFKLPGLQKYLQEKLQLEVRKMSGLERASAEAISSAPNYSENVGSFAVPYGLALQGLKLAKIQTNLLPNEVRVERIVRGKKPWVAAAAAALIAAVSVMLYGAGVNRAAISTPEIEKALSQGKSTQGAASNNKSALDNLEKEIEDSKKVVEKLSAGVPQRNNWRLLYRYINLSLPQPNGDRLTQFSRDGINVQQKYITKEAAQAFRFLEEKRFSLDKNPLSPKVVQERDEFIKKHLIQVNVTGISTVYTEDVAGFLLNLWKNGKALRGMDEPDQNVVKKVADAAGDPEKLKDLPIPKDGHIVEIRGYTYHDGQLAFLKESIVENIKVYPGGMRAAGPGKRTPIYPISKEMEEKVQKNISFIAVPVLEVVTDPVPGRFVHIGNSMLRSLTSSGGGVAGGMPGAMIGMDPQKMLANQGGAPGPAGGNDAAGSAKPSREGWSPIGDVASTVLGAGGGGAAAGGIFGNPFGGGGPRGAPPGGEMPAGPGGAAAPAAPPGGEPVGPGIMPGNPAPAPRAGSSPRQPRSEFVILFVWREPLPVQDPAAAEAAKTN